MTGTEVAGFRAGWGSAWAEVRYRGSCTWSCHVYLDRNCFEHESMVSWIWLLSMKRRVDPFRWSYSNLLILHNLNIYTFAWSSYLLQSNSFQINDELEKVFSSETCNFWLFEMLTSITDGHCGGHKSGQILELTNTITITQERISWVSYKADSMTHWGKGNELLQKILNSKYIGWPYN